MVYGGTSRTPSPTHSRLASQGRCPLRMPFRAWLQRRVGLEPTPTLFIFKKGRRNQKPRPLGESRVRAKRVRQQPLESRRLSVSSFRIEIAYCYPLSISFSPSKKAAAHCPGAISTHNVSDFDSSLTPVP